MTIARLLSGILAFTVLAGATPREDAFRARVRQMIEHQAARVNTADPRSGGYMQIAAKLWLNQDIEWCSRRVETLSKDPSGDVFWMYPATAVAYLGRDKLSPQAREAMRRTWRTYMPYRGDTENHWLLYYSTLYLMAQHYRGESGENWFTGRSSQENFKEAESYLLHWMDLTVTRGQGEYDCTHYIGVFLLPLSYLAAWSDDPTMRLRAHMMLDYIIADYAAENLDGMYVGSHARTDDRQVLEKWNGVSSTLGWLLFGVGRPIPGYDNFSFYYAAASAYMPPDVIHGIATDREKPYLHRELKRTRHRWRFSDERNAPVYKTTYVRREYAVGSDQGGLLQPIQQHSWDVTWALPDPRGVQNTIFAIHPYSSTYELQMYFTPMADFITEWVVRSKRTYDSEDKFLGGSPHEQIMQDLDTVIALYDIPAGTRYPHINGFFSKDLSRLEEHPSRWIFAQGGDTYIAWYPLAPYEWRPLEKGGKRLFSPHLKNGAVVQAAAVSEFAGFEAFQKAILALPLKVLLDPVPSVRFRSLRGRELAFTYGRERLVDGRPIGFEKWKLFEGPWMNSERGSRKLVLTHGKSRRTLDFNTLKVTGTE